MSLEEELNDLLEAIIPNTYAGKNPLNNNLPYCNFFEVSPGRVYSHEGYSKIARPRWQIDVYAETYDSVRTLSDTIVNSMETWKFSSMLQNRIDRSYEDCYSVILDFYINFKE